MALHHFEDDFTLTAQAFCSLLSHTQKKKHNSDQQLHQRDAMCDAMPLCYVKILKNNYFAVYIFVH